MKIRKGFVSNSSSSSFILDLNSDNPIFNTTYDIAKYMIGCRDGYENNNILLNKLEKAIKKNIITKESNLYFRSCNYDTYIVREYNYNKIYIATCNNHDFEKLNNYYAEEDELLDSVKNNERFYDIEQEIFITYIPYDQDWDKRSCKKKDCYSDKFKTDLGEIACPLCETKKFKQFSNLLKDISFNDLLNEIRRRYENTTGICK